MPADNTYSPKETTVRPKPTVMKALAREKPLISIPASPAELKPENE
jgi:hypothetical protein